MTLAYAVVRGDPPEVFAADDLDTLHRVLALEVVAATPGGTLPPGLREDIREALLDERWGDAVVRWMEATQVVVDVYGSGLQVWTSERFADRNMTGLELQLRPLFDDE